MRIRESDTLDRLVRDMDGIVARSQADMAAVVRSNVTQGNALAREFAKKSSGPHGLNYFKRITSEMTGPLTGEYGPHGSVVGRAVGAGYRGGAINNDLPRSLDIQGPRFAKDVGNLADKWFW